MGRGPGAAAEGAGTLTSASPAVVAVERPGAARGRGPGAGGEAGRGSVRRRGGAGEEGGGVGPPPRVF